MHKEILPNIFPMLEMTKKFKEMILCSDPHLIFCFQKAHNLMDILLI